jgi:hypothetical protein
MDIDYAVGILGNDLRSHQRQVAGKNDKLGTGLVNSLNNCFVPGFNGIKVLLGYYD